ncbi:MAG: polyphenol oxidase family protein [Candidatus Omnitrophica bacterium]|nr:hypothetical protein [bacterium]NUN98094.1 polyphenol oxidase family protein [Candidatus Omnitrophota bacterium]
MTLFPALLRELTPARAAFSERDPDLPGMGNASLAFGSKEEALCVRAGILSQIGLDLEALVLAEQVHGDVIHRARFGDRGRGSLSQADRLPPGDGLVTDVPGLAVGVLVADCCCILVADRGGRAVGAFHSGWRGTVAGIAARAVETFEREFKILPDELMAWISPAISVRNYTVGAEVWNAVRERWGTDRLREDPLRVDLAGLCRDQMVQAGLPAAAIEVCDGCTLESPRWFSHRRGDLPEGRMLGVIALPGVAPTGSRRGT